MSLLTGNEHFCARTLLDEGRGISVNGSILRGVDGATFIDWLTDNVDDSSKGFWTNGHHDWVACVFDFLATDESLSGVQGNRADVVATQVLGDFQNQAVAGASDFERVQNRW